MFIPRMAVSVLSLLHATQWTKFGGFRIFFSFLMIFANKHFSTYSTDFLSFLLVSWLPRVETAVTAVGRHSALTLCKLALRYPSSYCILSILDSFENVLNISNILSKEKREHVIFISFIFLYNCNLFSFYLYSKIQSRKNFESRHFKKIITA